MIPGSYSTLPFRHARPSRSSALSFLITIGIVLILEAFHHDVPKPYIYLPMGFATLVQLLQWRLMRNQSGAGRPRAPDRAPSYSPSTLPIM